MACRWTRAGLLACAVNFAGLLVIVVDIAVASAARFAGLLAEVVAVAAVRGYAWVGGWAVGSFVSFGRLCR